MEACALASGSSGNCFYISDDKKNAVLIDAGISCKQIVEKLEMIDKKPEKIKALLITHEHSDHIRGADVFSRSFNVPIYITKKTADNCFICSDNKLINFIKNTETFRIDAMEIEAFSKSHKAADPVGFSINGKKRVSVITDAGYACKSIKSHIKDAGFLFLEANHDLEMLEQGNYPWHLKKWIKSDLGHLSNKQAALAVLEYGGPKLKNIILSHISKNNNTPELALKTFQLLKERKDLQTIVDISQRQMPTKLFQF